MGTILWLLLIGAVVSLFLASVVSTWLLVDYLRQWRRERRSCPMCLDLGGGAGKPETWCNEHYWRWLATSDRLKAGE